jgi:hypothetical protein|tara:strand:+ start:20695 stop:21381 length:687 start_codon:yes stop_codon:yes gene_type:complete
MPRILLLIAILFSVWYWWKVVKSLPSEKRRPFLWRTAFWSVLGLSVILVASGRMHWLGAGLAALIPLAKGAFALGLRALPFMQILSRFKTSPSQFRTKSLLVQVNFASKQMDGEILQGEFTGKRLSGLNSEELQRLSASFKETDRESYLLLQTYLLRNNRGDSNNSDQANNLSELTDQEAYEILGLEANAAKEDIIKAHKRLMQRLHPDRGGSNYLAAKINAAKDKLM